jgi:REP element-mobilizing transposase RayT
MGRRGRANLTDEHFFFVTTTVVKYIPIFEDHSFCDILIENIKFYQNRYRFEILAYVIMPSHFHWIVEVKPKYGTISDIMRDIKKFTAWKIFDEIDKGKHKELENIFREEAKGLADQKRKFWMPRFDDEVIRNQKMFWVKAGLVYKPDDYKYSSARNYLTDDHNILKVNTEMGGVKL